MRRPEAIVFDWDNTLVDSWATIHDALNVTLIAMRHPPWTLSETKMRVRLSLHDSFPKLFGDSWKEARQLYLDSFERIHLDRLTPLTGAATCLKALSEAGYYVAIASNKTGRLLRREVEALKWNGYFSRVVGAGDAAADKPHRAPIDMALDGSGIDAGSTVWYVGDTDVDIESSRNANCIGILLHSVVGETDAAAEMRPDFAFADFAAFMSALETSQV